MEKQCKGCDKKFNCLGTEDCWCNKIKISYEKKLELESCNDDCFCEDCLLSEEIRQQN